MNLNNRYRYETIEERDILIAVPSLVIAIGILYMPRSLADTTIGLDAIYPLLFGGGITVLFIWLVGRIASRFPEQSFLTYASKLTTKPIAIAISFLFALHGILITSFELRGIAEISHLYLFEQTPIEIIGLTFLLVVVYAVSGSRAAIFRLNALFLPIIMVAVLFLLLFSFGFTRYDNSIPIFQTDLQGYWMATHRSILSVSGFGVFGYLLFYISLVRSPKQAPKKAVFGMIWVVVLHLMIVVITVLVFGNITTENLTFPVIELARTIEVPGGFFNRFASLFFIIWTMAIFNTCAMAFDVAVLALQSIFKNIDKKKIVFVLSPIIFFLTGLPKNQDELGMVGRVIGYFGLGLVASVTILFLLLYKIRGVK
ncbi:GerAB/ArcD/ProY family transporter [Aquibacillus sediminis]|uniref:GerAB/ArcD/ProY family transporter n=1 Tax=Aquibacillus sediminis TaxID=2574734 RepID=UPI001109F49C|nr:endospore germination permease [Aquibacillus sediminis]